MRSSEQSQRTAPTRRAFLQAGIASSLAAFLDRTAPGARPAAITGYGRLSPVVDETTGLELLSLPDGFRYSSFGWTGDDMADGGITPGAHDGMGIVLETDDRITLIRNHELKERSPDFGSEQMQFDPRAGGGCSRLQFDSRAGKWTDAVACLAGTVKNCAGGPTPWGTWLSCEESVLGPGDFDDDRNWPFQQQHGWIFEVPAEGCAVPKPLKSMGRFVHEAVAVDPDTGIVYETEDRGTAGFYRYLPNKAGQLQAGGKLQMLRIPGLSDTRTGLKVGHEFDVDWVDIEDPERAHWMTTSSPEQPNGDELGVFMQGKVQGAATFARLEGCWYGNNRIYLVSTNGGNARSGQVWQFDPRNQRLRLIFESPGADILDSPDNICVSPRGGLLLCEDGEAVPHRLHGMTPDGKLFAFAENNIILNGERNGFRGDFRAEEWAGATFSSDGKWLFVNIQTPGITFAITGPWENGLL